jgi:hypothetical protein
LVLTVVDEGDFLLLLKCVEYNCWFGAEGGCGGLEDLTFLDDFLIFFSQLFLDLR